MAYIWAFSEEAALTARLVGLARNLARGLACYRLCLAQRGLGLAAQLSSQRNAFWPARSGRNAAFGEH